MPGAGGGVEEPERAGGRAAAVAALVGICVGEAEPGQEAGALAGWKGVGLLVEGDLGGVVSPGAGRKLPSAQGSARGSA